MNRCSTCEYLELDYIKQYTRVKRRKRKRPEVLEKFMVKTKRPSGKLELIPDRAFCSRTGKYIGKIAEIEKQGRFGHKVLLKDVAEVFRCPDEGNGAGGTV